MNRIALFALTLTIALTISPAVGATVRPPPVDPSAIPTPITPTVPYVGGTVEEPPAAEPENWLIMPVMRESVTGGEVPAYYLINGEMLGVTEDDLHAKGITTITLDDVARASPIEYASVALAYPDVSSKIEEIQAEKSTVCNLNLTDFCTMTHPAPPITYATTLPVTVYYDDLETEQADWSANIVSSMDSTASLLTSEIGTSIYRYLLVYVNPSIATDVSTWCHMQRIADEEAMFRPHVGAFATIFSPNDIERGSWGVTVNGPITAQLTDATQYNYCDGSQHSPAFIPSVYVKDKPLFSVTYMKYVTAHEIGHVLGEEHSHAYCYTSGVNIRKTLEAFTSGPGVPPECGAQLDPRSVWVWDYSNNPPDHDGVGAMQAERTKWTTCYNQGQCSSNNQELARHDGSITSCCEFFATGTFITFNGISAGSPIDVTYKYCYVANTNGVAGHIRTVFDGTTVDDLSFQTPFTGGGSCTDGNVNTYATRSFTVQSGVSSSIRFDYTNGDWRLSIADIRVMGPGNGAIFSDDMEQGTNGWSADGLWHMATRRSNSPSNAWWYGQEGTGNYETGGTNSGNLYSPCISIPSGVNARLTYKSWYQTEDTGTSYDKKRVYITRDGSNWDLLTFVSGTNLVWTTQSADIIGYGQPNCLQLRFEFDTVDNLYNNFEGWYIDDVTVVRI